MVDGFKICTLMLLVLVGLGMCVDGQDMRSMVGGCAAHSSPDPADAQSSDSAPHDAGWDLAGEIPYFNPECPYLPPDCVCPGCGAGGNDPGAPTPHRGN